MYKAQQYRSEDGVKTVVVGPAGRKTFPVLIMTQTGYGLVVKKLPLEEQRYLTDLPKGSVKALRTHLRVFRNFGKSAGMTKAAKTFLAQANKAA